MLLNKTMSFLPEQLISLEYYAAQSNETFTDKANAYKHFLEKGQKANLNPSPFFYTAWYIWQNSDSVNFPTVLEHFIHCGQYIHVDPAPFLDSVSFLAANKNYATIVEGVIALTEGKEALVSPKLNDHLDALASQQVKIHKEIASYYIRKKPTKRKRLVWVQAGSRFNFDQWFRQVPRTWDLMCNWYTLNGLDLRYGEIHLSQPGTKATAMYHVMQNDPELFNNYDQLLFLDDDLHIKHEEIDSLFDIAEQEKFDIYQPAILSGSYSVWEDLFQKNQRGTRQTTGIEIMMPGFTRHALFSCSEIFGQSISGHGLDFMMSEHVRNYGGKCGVIDSVAVEHKVVIDEQDGAYYKLMRSIGINHKLELFAAIYKLGKFPTFSEIQKP